MRSDKQAIHETHATWIDAVNGGDLARLLALMTNDVVFLNPGREPFGRDEFPAGFSAAHDKFEIHCISKLMDAVVVGDVAYTTCIDSLSLKPRVGGEATELAGHRMTVYRKQTDGRWLLARDAHTLSPARRG